MTVHGRLQAANRVGDCRAAYEELRGRRAEFLTPPLDRGAEIRCFFRDPDGHLFEISQARDRRGGARASAQSGAGGP